MAVAAATTNPTAAARTVPVRSSTSPDAMDVTMTGTEEGGTQSQSSIPSKRKSAAPEAIEEKGHTQTSSKKKNNSAGVRFTLRNPQWAYLHLELYGTTTSLRYLITVYLTLLPKIQSHTTTSLLHHALSRSSTCSRPPHSPQLPDLRSLPVPRSDGYLYPNRHTKA